MPNTREKLIESIEQGYNKYFNPNCGGDLFAVIADHLIANGVTLANQVASSSKQVASSKWIPVSERLPEDDLPKDTKRKMIRCLVYTDKGTVKPCVRQRWEHFDGKMQPWVWNKDWYAKPTHWMPLPEAPKGE